MIDGLTFIIFGLIGIALLAWWIISRGPGLA
jgi:hypothetical protein